MQSTEVFSIDDNSRVRLLQTNPNQQKHFNDYINATSIGVRTKTY